MQAEQLFISILLIHWVADFLFQTSYQAQNKYNNLKALLGHTITYSLCWFVYLLSAEDSMSLIILFVLITFIMHTLTDFITSKITHDLYVKKDWHYFFVFIGIDQILHYVQLWYTFKILFGIIK